MGFLPTLVRLATFLSIAFGGGAGSVLFGQAVEQDRVMAAMSIQMLSFVETRQHEWPEGTQTIGVFADEGLFEDTRALLEEPEYEGRYQAMLILPEMPIEEWGFARAVLFGSEGRRDVADTIRIIGQRPMLLLGSHDGFLDQGGMVNFARRQSRMSFDIHLGHARSNGIEFRSRLLRLANRVIE